MRASSLAAAVMLAAAGAPAQAGPAVLFDAADGRVLYAEDLDNQWHPASLTKIMTAYLTFEALKAGKLTLTQKLPYSENAQRQPPSKLGLIIGAQLLVDSALKALIIKSANDVAVVLAEAVSGDELSFVAKMNETAKRLGMSRTTFVNSSGLPAVEQVTTARDLGKLARAVVRDFPEYAPYWSMYDARIGKIYIGTHNGLLKSFDGADGMKTGFICDSGYNIVATATREGRRLVAVVLGETSGGDRTLRAAGLLEHGFQQYGWKTLFSAPNLDAVPAAADAKGIMNMREVVLAWDCGAGRRPRVRKIRIKRPDNAAGKPHSVEAPKATGAAGASAAAPATAPGANPAPAKAANAPVPVQAKPAAAPVQASVAGPAKPKPKKEASSSPPAAAKN